MCGCKNKGKTATTVYTYTAPNGQTTDYKVLAEAQAAVIRKGGKYTTKTVR